MVSLPRSKQAKETTQYAYKFNMCNDLLFEVNWVESKLQFIVAIVGCEESSFSGLLFSLMPTDHLANCFWAITAYKRSFIYENVKMFAERIYSYSKIRFISHGNEMQIGNLDGKCIDGLGNFLMARAIWTLFCSIIIKMTRQNTELVIGKADIVFVRVFID